MALPPLGISLESPCCPCRVEMLLSLVVGSDVFPVSHGAWYSHTIHKSAALRLAKKNVIGVTRDLGVPD
jgi:hypothetical protein